MRARLGLKVLGLCALVMGVMTIGTAGVAQAESGACFGYDDGIEIDFPGGTVLGPLPCFSASLEAKPVLTFENSSATLVVGNVNIEVLCTTATPVEGGVLSANGSILLGRVEFGGCVSLTKTPTLTKVLACTPKDPVAGLGKIRTEKGTGLIVLHNGEPVVALSPDVGTTLAKIFLGEECAVSEELIITGKLIIHDTPTPHINGEGKVVPLTSKQHFERHTLTHLIQEYPNLKLMKVGVNSASIEGTATVMLFIPHNSMYWAGKAA